MTPEPPIGLLAELTHRCPLACVYCSNPERLVVRSDELPTHAWTNVLSEAAALGVLQVHLSGGEPLARTDLTTLVAHAANHELYTTLATSGIGLTERRAHDLARAGLDHVQLSLQSLEPANAERIARLRAPNDAKFAAARFVRAAGMALTLNVVLHRMNLHEVPRFLEAAIEVGAKRLELAHVQFQGWALRNRASLLPTRAEVDEVTSIVEAARTHLRGKLTIDYVAPDFHAVRPKACMGGWGRLFLVVTPEGKVLPCHAAESIAGLVFEKVGDRPLREIWSNGQAFQRFRGVAWMPEPCRSCDDRERDWGGCRCQALALTGRADVTDPACDRSPDRPVLLRLVKEPSAPEPLVHRGVSMAPRAD